MYKIIIVEDEEIFRKVLPAIIDWSSIGFGISGVVENGYEALKLLDTIEVDVILTDIRMPILNGLELAMEIKSKYPKVKTILLSAFNEFEYVRKGIDCGVYGYLLKSDDEEDIKKFFIKLKGTIDFEYKMNVENENYWYSREAVLKHILENKNFDDQAIRNELKKCGIEPTYGNITVSLIKLDEYKRTMEKLGISKVKSINKDIRTFCFQNIEVKKLGFIVQIEDEICILWTIPYEAAKENMSKVYNELSEELSLLGDISITCSFGNEVKDLEEITKTFLQASNAFLHKIYLGGSRIIYYPDLLGINEFNLTFAEEDKIIKDIQIIINEGNSQEIIQYFDKLEQNLIENRFMKIDQIATLSIKVILSISNVIGKMRVEPEEYLTKSGYCLREIANSETIYTVFKYLKLFLVEVIVILSKENGALNNKIIDKAIEYIKDNYADPIGLESVSKHVNVHPVHLSRLFSQDFGKTFKNVLTETRIDMAKKLLLDINYKVYEVATLVGYENPRYFSELFRSTSGMTPIEYREKFRE